MYRIIILLLIISSCRNPIEETDKFEFFLKTDDSTTLIIHNKISSEYFTYHNFKENPIDILSLKNESSFLTDKMMVFRKYEISDDCLIIAAPEIDRTSFVAFNNSIYRKDKNYVYDCRNGKIQNADVYSFESLKIETKTSTAYGKDKNNYYFWDKVVTDTIGFSKLYKEWKNKNKSAV